MYPLYEKQVQKKIKQLCLYLSISLFMVWIYAWMFPLIAGSAEQLDLMMEAFPPEFLQAFNIEPTASVFSSFEGFLTAEYFSFMWPLLVIIFATSLAAHAVAGEIEAGTMEILLAQPISRTKLYVSKILEGLTILTLFVIVSVGSIAVFGLFFGIDIKGIEYVTLIILSLLFAYAIYAVALLISTCVSSRGIVTGSVLALMAGMYVINVVSSSMTRFEYIGYVSFFHYYDYSAALFDNRIPNSSIAIFLAVIMGSFVIGWSHFRNRDV